MMKIDRNTAYYQRDSKPREFTKKLFIASEGERTEINYIRYLIEHADSKEEDVVFLESPCSNPNVILNHVIQAIESGGHMDYPAGFVFESFKAITKCTKKNAAKLRSVYDKWLRVKGIRDNDILSPEQAEEAITLLAGRLGEKQNVSAYFEYLKSQSEYDPDLDLIFLVADRDRHSFTKAQYLRVLKNSEAYGIKLAITNPCIEFFFLLHHTDCSEYSKKSLLQNRKHEGKTFVHRKLVEYDAAYGKKIKVFKFYQKQYENAKTNASRFSHDPASLESEVGTSLFDLIDRII